MDGHPTGGTRPLVPTEIVRREAEITQDAVERAGRNFAPMPWNQRASVALRGTVPVVARAMTQLLNAHAV